MATAEALNEIQRRAHESLNSRRLPNFIKRAGLTGSITCGIRHHPDTVKTTLIAGGFLIAVIAGVALVHSNTGGQAGLQATVTATSNQTRPVFEWNP